jgi:nucleoside-diphosphate-sugar epimerase
VAGAEPPISRRTLAFFENDNAFDIGAARRALGFDPRTDLAAGLRAVIASGGAGSSSLGAPGPHSRVAV